MTGKGLELGRVSHYRIDVTVITKDYDIFVWYQNRPERSLFSDFVSRPIYSLKSFLFIDKAGEKSLQNDNGS